MTSRRKLWIESLGQFLLLGLMIVVMRFTHPFAVGGSLAYSFIPMLICIASGAWGAWNSLRERTSSVVITLLAWLFGAAYFIISDQLHIDSIRALGGHAEFGGVILTIFESFVAAVLIGFGFAAVRLLVRRRS